MGRIPGHRSGMEVERPALESAVWTGVLAVPLGSQVTLGKSQNLSEPQTLHL